MFFMKNINKILYLVGVFSIVNILKYGFIKIIAPIMSPLGGTSVGDLKRCHLMIFKIAFM